MISAFKDAEIVDVRQNSSVISLAGFSAAESYGRWTDGPDAAITIQLPTSPSAFLAIVFEHRAFVVREKLPAQKLVISIDGDEHETWVLRDAIFRVRALIIDRRTLKNPSAMTLGLSLPNCATPSAFGLNEDYRLLGMNVRRLYLLNLDERPDQQSPLCQIGRRYVGTESRKTWDEKYLSGFWARFITGPRVLDVGFASYGEPHIQPIVEGAIGVDIDYPGYDGRTLPFPDGSQDAVYSSHCLEHIPDYIHAIQDWHRVIRTGGHIITVVPSLHLYERKLRPPSRWNPEHMRMYSPASLLREFEAALTPNTFRVRYLEENDLDYDYSRGLDEGPAGNYEIVLVIQKITPPSWRLAE